MEPDDTDYDDVEVTEETKEKIREIADYGEGVQSLGMDDLITEPAHTGKTALVPYQQPIPPALLNEEESGLTASTVDEEWTLEISEMTTLAGMQAIHEAAKFVEEGSEKYEGEFYTQGTKKRY